MRRLLPIIVLLALVANAAPRPVSAHGAEEAEAAAAVAVELSVFEAEGAFDKLYDRIHPDAAALAPHGAVVGWYENAFAPLGPGEITVVGVEFVDWTWGVTGETYPDTAEVAFTQPFAADDSSVESTVHLVEDDAGEWRWFFGGSRAFVDEQVARYVMAPEETEELDLIREDLDDFWSRIADEHGLVYETPELVFATGDVESACGTTDGEAFAAFYCGYDETIYLQVDFAVFLYARGDFALALVVGHEWAHHVQAQNGGYVVISPDRAPASLLTFYTIEIELQADCLAGVWAGDADARGWLDPGDVEEATDLSREVGGDLPGTSVYDLYAHGTGEQRADAFLTGYEDGFAGCDFTLEDAGS